MFSMGTLDALVVVVVLLTELCAVSLAVPSKPSKQQQQQHALSQGPVPGEGQDRKAPEEEREKINSVTVKCHPDHLEILIQADLFGVGLFVRSNDLRLGADSDDRCKPASSSDQEYTLTAGLLDCGTKHWMTRDSLVYTNLLIYSPEPSAGGVVRAEEAVIPIECHYNRKYSLSSLALAPTWVPFVSRQSTVKKLNFDMTIMTPDWLYKRRSNVFYLGEVINIETSVLQGHHIDMRVYLSSCVATLSPNEHSMPRYVFIENGCLIDSQLPNSRSQFLRRVQDDKLHLVLDSFRFHNEDRTELYISCNVTAVPVHDAEANNKACTFINGRWISADGNDYLCGHCQAPYEEGHIKGKPGGHFRPRSFRGPETQERLWRSGLKSEPEFKTKARVGPLTVLEKKMEPTFDVPLYGSVWRSGLHRKTGITDIVEKPEDLIENDLPEDIAEKGLVPDQVFSPEEDPENATEAEDDFFPDLTKEDYDDTDDETLEEDDVHDFSDFDLGENLDAQDMEVQETEMMPDFSDINTTPEYGPDITISINDTHSETATKEPKR